MLGAVLAVMQSAVIIPTLNEEAHIEPLIRGLLRSAPPTLTTILVADGGSTDSTRALVKALARDESRVRLLENPDRIQASGCNRAARVCGSDVEVLVRIDAHSGYPDGYVSRLTETMMRTGADSVVVRLRSAGQAPFQEAVASVSNSRLGTGGSLHRIGGRSGWVDHGHHAAIRRDRFLELGGYDERFPANEDAEFDVRLRRAGGRIWLATDIEVTYYPRSTVRGLAVQYFRYGRGRARTALKTRERLRLRQLAAPALVLGLGAAAGLTSLTSWSLAVPAAYLGLLIAVSVQAALGGKRLSLLLSGIALAMMHLAWGSGFWIELISGGIRRLREQQHLDNARTHRIS